MDSRTSEHLDEIPSVETPEDVAVLYSWANLHGAKYRDFSASRREYRAQLRHRAAEQIREVELRAQANAESAATLAEANARQAEQTATDHETGDAQHQQALRDAEEAARLATAERIEAARRAESAAEAQALARKEEREIVEASASARRQAALYTESEARHRRQQTPTSDKLDIPGKISDPYTPDLRTPEPESEAAAPSAIPQAAVELHPNRHRLDRPAPPSEVVSIDEPSQPLADLRSMPSVVRPPVIAPNQGPQVAKRRQGYRPDDASGVRQIYRPEMESSPEVTPTSRFNAGNPTPIAAAPSPKHEKNEPTPAKSRALDEVRPVDTGMRQWTAAPTTPPPVLAAPPRQVLWANSLQADRRSAPPTPADIAQSVSAAASPVHTPHRDQPAGELEDPTPKRRRQDLAGYKPTDSDRAIAAYRREQAQPVAYANAPSPRMPDPPQAAKVEIAPVRQTKSSEPVGPAWIYAQTQADFPSSDSSPQLSEGASTQTQESVTDTLQRSRERVASRWYALKGVFEHVGQERQEPAPARQKETRTPVLAVFSLAGGVGKTSLVATLGRSLSSLGEKVLLTDTTSHGLLPYYFGASELRQGTVRTFSPPSGSTDAPIYLVNYGVDQDPGDEATQEALVEDIVGSGRGTHRIILDLTSSTGWVIRRVARLNPTILVPVAPDMNSVISLQAIEKFFHGVNGADGAPLKFFYVLNQFDAALPLHLDVREVLRRQLGEKLLPFAIRRAPAVSEALAEGMTIVDYSPEAPVAEDYMNVATWLRAQSAPATAGFRNVRWSER